MSNITASWDVFNVQGQPVKIMTVRATCQAQAVRKAHLYDDCYCYRVKRSGKFRGNKRKALVWMESGTVNPDFVLVEV
jgi:hypothetical protein